MNKLLLLVHSRFSGVSVVALVIMLFAGTTAMGAGNYAVGPRAVVPVVQEESTGLTVLIPVLDPNLPEDPDDYEKTGIWPEVRNTEANRFAVQLSKALTETNAFDAVRVSPDSQATGHIYVFGKILKSNAEDVVIEIAVYDISGTALVKAKKFEYLVKEYYFDDPRNKDTDKYTPIFGKIASVIAKAARKLKPKRIETLVAIADIRFAESYAPEKFSRYLKTTKKGVTELVSLPAATDPTLVLIKSLETKDRMFIDNIQADYDSFRAQSDEHYLPWQRAAFISSKAARKAKKKAKGKLWGAAAAAVGGLVIGDKLHKEGMKDGVMGGGENIIRNANTVALGNVTQIGGLAAAAGLAVSAIGDLKDAKAYRGDMSELGRSLNFELAPRVMKVEGDVIELKGTASEQYSEFRLMLQKYFAAGKTPDVSL